MPPPPPPGRGKVAQTPGRARVNAYHPKSIRTSNVYAQLFLVKSQLEMRILHHAAHLHGPH